MLLHIVSKIVFSIALVTLQLIMTIQVFSIDVKFIDFGTQGGWYSRW